MRQREVAAMTDARLPERWLSDRRLSRLSDAHDRSYIQALLFSVSNRTDGVIEPDDLALIPHFAPGAVNAFLAQELWSARQHGWFITDRPRRPCGASWRFWRTHAPASVGRSSASARRLPMTMLRPRGRVPRDKRRRPR